MLLTDNPGENPAASCTTGSFQGIKRTQRIFRPGVIDDFGFTALRLCIINRVPINRFGGPSSALVYPINPEPTARLEC